MTTKAKNKAPLRQAGQKRLGDSNPIFLIVFAVIAVALVAAIVLSSDKPVGSEGEYGEPSITGAPLPPFGDGTSAADDPAVGTTAPQVTGKDFDGSTVSITPDGTPKVIMFIAHWCPHCQAEVPRVQDWLNSGGGVIGVDIISVTTSASSGADNWPPSAWLDREGWTSPNIRDDQANSVLNAFGGSSFPFWVFLNGDGTVALRLAGEIGVDNLKLVMDSLASASQ
jgi:thiol-disulfide isomerase/thioredoxin